MYHSTRQSLSRTVVLVSQRFKTNNKPRDNKSIYPVHLSQKPPASPDIDFSNLGLKYPVVHDTTFVIPRLGWSPPRETLPDLPFAVPYR